MSCRFKMPPPPPPQFFIVFSKRPLAGRKRTSKNAGFFGEISHTSCFLCASNEIPGARTTKFPRENQQCSPNSRIKKFRKFHWNWFGDYWTQGGLEYLQEKDVFIQSSHGRSPEGENLKNTLNTVDLKIKTGLQTKMSIFSYLYLFFFTEKWFVPL